MGVAFASISPVQRRLGLLAVTLIPLGVATKLYSGPGAVWVRGNAGGAVYVAFWCLLVLSIWPRLSTVRVAGAAFGFTALVEFLQLWHPPLLEAARATLFGQALLGSYFSWADFPYYLAGAAGAVALARWAKGTASRSPHGAP